jgi:hypothetical protein
MEKGRLKWLAISWKAIINNLKVDDLPEDGLTAPYMEEINIEEKVKTSKIFVQKLVIEVYIYTDVDNFVQGQTTFQTTTLLGEMTAAKLSALIKREKAKRNKAP